MENTNNSKKDIKISNLNFNSNDLEKKEIFTNIASINSSIENKKNNVYNKSNWMNKLLSNNDRIIKRDFNLNLNEKNNINFEYLNKKNFNLNINNRKFELNNNKLNINYNNQNLIKTNENSFFNENNLANDNNFNNDYNKNTEITEITEIKKKISFEKEKSKDMANYILHKDKEIFNFPNKSNKIKKNDLNYDEDCDSTENNLLDSKYQVSDNLIQSYNIKDKF